MYNYSVYHLTPQVKILRKKMTYFWIKLAPVKSRPVRTKPVRTRLVRTRPVRTRPVRMMILLKMYGRRSF